MPVCGDHKLTSGFHKSLIKNDTTAKKTCYYVDLCWSDRRAASLSLSLLKHSPLCNYAPFQLWMRLSLKLATNVSQFPPISRGYNGTPSLVVNEPENTWGNNERDYLLIIFRPLPTKCGTKAEKATCLFIRAAKRFHLSSSGVNAVKRLHRCGTCWVWSSQKCLPRRANTAICTQPCILLLFRSGVALRDLEIHFCFLLFWEPR